MSDRTPNRGLMRPFARALVAVKSSAPFPIEPEA
jgi:hypothetical protein